MNFEVYAYWNIEELATTFNAVAALMGSGNYLGLLRSLAIVGLLSLALVVLAGKGRMEEFWKWVIMLALFNGMLFVPKTNVTIVDRTGTTAPQVVANVPIGLAAFAHSTSKIGDWLTNAFETVFALPGDLQFRSNGTLFGHRVLHERQAIKSGQPVVTANFFEFYRECVAPELASGYVRMNDLMKSNDLWASLDGVTNPSRLVTIRDAAAPSVMQTLGCNAAYGVLTNQLAAETQQQLGLLGGRLYPGMASALANAAIAGSLSSTTNYLLGLSANATDAVRQSIVANAVIDAQYVIPSQIGDAATAATNLAQAQAVRQTSDSYRAMAKLAESTMPKVRNAIELIQYALFPLILIFALVAGHHGLTVLKMYAGSLIWIQLWPPLYAVMNFLMNVQAQKSLTSATQGGGMSLEAYGFINNAIVGDQAIAGMLVLSIPAIAAALIRWGDAGLRSVGSSFTPRDAEKLAAGLAQGNLSMGNASLGNVQYGNASQMQHALQPTLASGVPRMSAAGLSGSVERSGDALSVRSGSMTMTGFDSNRDGRFTIDEVTNVSAPGSALMGATAQSSAARSTSMVDYSGEGTQFASGRTASISQSRGARLSEEQSAGFQRQLAQAMSREIGADERTSRTRSTSAGLATGRDVSGRQGLVNQEGAVIDSAIAAGGGGATQKPIATEKGESGRLSGMAMALAEKAAGVSARISGGFKTGQRYDESGEAALRTATQEELREAADMARRGLMRVAGTTSDQGVKQAAERAAATLEDATSFATSETATLTEQREAGSRRQAADERRAGVMVDESLVMARTGFEALFGKGAEVTPERLAAFQREWNNNRGFREDVAMQASSTAAGLLGVGPEGRGVVRQAAKSGLAVLERRGDAMVQEQSKAGRREVQSGQFAAPRVMPELTPAAREYASTLSDASEHMKRKESQVLLDSGALLMANELYLARLRGASTVLLNTLGFGAGSASVQDYAKRLKAAAQDDAELAGGLTAIALNNRSGAAPSEANMAWLEKQAIHAVRRAEGPAAEGAGRLVDGGNSLVEILGRK